MFIDTTEQKLGCSVSSHDLNLSQKKERKGKGKKKKKTRNYFQHNQSLLWKRRCESGEQKTWHDEAINILLCSRRTPVKSDGEIRQNGRTRKQPWFIAGPQSRGGAARVCVCAICVYICIASPCAYVAHVCVSGWAGSGGVPPAAGVGYGALTHTRTQAHRVCAWVNTAFWLGPNSEFLWVTGSLTRATERGWRQDVDVLLCVFFLPFFLCVRVMCRTADWEECARRRKEARLVHADPRPAIDRLIDQCDCFSPSWAAECQKTSASSARWGKQAGDGKISRYSSICDLFFIIFL